MNTRATVARLWNPALHVMGPVGQEEYGHGVANHRG